ncbi:glycosyltransferase family 87 protein [Prevotella sp. 10(H)]|uniref:glycosyltransferase family 87 protein n=1 Tax=Prevotella sp. 10(H) TaxID=1158294 RepID=UPI0004A7527A|nr:glycosyltransferase family 87 protein [Prevotella sp. 10(H)]
MNAISRFFQRPIFYDKRLIFALWIGAALIAGISHIHKANNYQIFKHVFYHTIDQVNLYAEYPEQYFDTNHYGPLFSIIIAPFALLPDFLGIPLWEMVIAATLLIAIYKLPMSWKGKVIIYWIAMHEVYLNATNSQTNTLIAALVIGTFICIKSEKDFWAACFIMLGLFIKLYGIVGLAFFFFSRHKLKLIGYLILWGVIFFVLPMIISSPQFIVQSYADWYESLTLKNELNAGSIYQNVSALGMIQRVSGIQGLNLFILLPAFILFALQYIQVKAYNNPVYQYGLLASALMCIVLFSTGSENSTYIIAITGVALWFLIQKKPRSKYVIILFVFTLFVTLCAGSDIVPGFVRKEIIRPYSLKALPYLIVWLTLVYQLITFKKSSDKLSSLYFTESKGSE